MRFMIIVKGNKDSEAGAMPDESAMHEMAAYHEELARAGVLLDASGLQPTSKGVRIKYSGGKRTVTDGPFTESKEIIAGYTIIQVKTREEGLEWARRFPAPFPGGEGGDRSPSAVRARRFRAERRGRALQGPQEIGGDTVWRPLARQTGR